MISLDAFSELLEVLYSVPLRQERWGRFLDLLCEHTRSRSSFLICANSRLGTSIQAQGGAMALTANAVEAYSDQYAPKDPYRLPMLANRELGVLDCEALVSTRELLQTEMYRHIIAPAGLRHPSLILLNCSLRRLEGISMWRTVEEGPMHGEGTRLLRLLVPHVRSAMETSYVLGVLEARAKGAEAMADASKTPTFLLTARGEVLHRNAAAEALLQEKDGLAIERGILTASCGAMRMPLRNLVRDAGAPSGFGQFTGVAKALSLERGSGRIPLQLLAAPSPQSQVNGAYAVLLLAIDQEKPVDISDEMMRAYYGFTPAETEIANGLLTGYSLEEIAALRRVSVGTVRYQMKSLFAKTGTGRQADLMRRLLTLPQMAQIGDLSPGRV